jgi:uncharacterized protein (DUF427 family)
VPDPAEPLGALEHRDVVVAGAAQHRGGADASEAAADDRYRPSWHTISLCNTRSIAHTVEIQPGSAHVRIELDGELVAESSRPTLVSETGYPVRTYLPREDIVAELRPSDKRTTCSFKGEASYWSVGAHENIAWSYEEPIEAAAALARLVSFYEERVD